MTQSIRTAWGGVVAYLACAWAVLFFLVHVYWLTGGTIGLPSGETIFDNTPLLVTDIVVIPASLVAIAVSLALVRPWGRGFPPSLLLVVSWGLGIGLIVHAIPVLPDWVMLVIRAKLLSELSADYRFSVLVYEPWFMIGGLLFCAAALGFHRRYRLFRPRPSVLRGTAKLRS